MGYDITLKVNKEEFDKKYDSFISNVTEEELENQKRILRASLFKIFNVESSEYFVVSKMNRDFNAVIKYFLAYVEGYWITTTKERIDEENEFNKKDEIHFCGWRFAKGRDEGDKEMWIEYLKDNLWDELALKPLPKDDEEFNIKIDSIKALINDTTDNLYDAYSEEFVNEFRDHICGGDDYEQDE